jgi:hypothetical protein
VCWGAHTGSLSKIRTCRVPDRLMSAETAIGRGGNHPGE